MGRVNYALTASLLANQGRTLFFSTCPSDLWSCDLCFHAHKSRILTCDGLKLLGLSVVNSSRLSSKTQQINCLVQIVRQQSHLCQTSISAGTLNSTIIQLITAKRYNVLYRSRLDVELHKAASIQSLLPRQRAVTSLSFFTSGEHRARDNNRSPKASSLFLSRSSELGKNLITSPR